MCCKKKLVYSKFYLLFFIVLRFKLHLYKPLTSYPEAGKQPKDETTHVNWQKQVYWVSPLRS